MSLPKTTYEQMFDLISAVADPSQGWEGPNGEPLTDSARCFLDWLPGALDLQAKLAKEHKMFSWMIYHRFRMTNGGFEYFDGKGWIHQGAVRGDIRAAIGEVMEGGGG